MHNSLLHDVIRSSLNCHQLRLRSSGLFAHCVQHATPLHVLLVQTHRIFLCQLSEIGQHPWQLHLELHPLNLVEHLIREEIHELSSLLKLLCFSR